MRGAVLFLFVGLGCSQARESAAVVDAAVADTAVATGEDVTVETFARTHVYFAGADNKRTVDVDATFPDKGTYERITLHLALDCPDGKCDAWDRFGTLGIVTAKGDKPENDTVFEVARYMTPYGVGGAWDLDVTELRPLLSGKLTLRGFIDTWVGPGHASGNGWLLSASFEMKGGVPAREPIAVLPIWTMKSGVYGDPNKPLSSSFPTQSPSLPAGASSYSVRAIITGHGQGNADNCAEFCPREHTITVGANAYKQKVWRTDCATTGVPGQKGTWKLSRAGWCPGAEVRVWSFDVESPGPIAYAVDTYVNSCRPDAETCTGCTLGTDCKYDGGAHTEPVYYVSAALIAYR